MSVLLLASALGCDLASRTRKLVLVKLCDCARDDGTKIFPAIGTIAKAAECSDRTAQRSIREFEAIGLLARVRDGGKAGPGAASTTEYRLDVERLGELARLGWTACAAGADFDPNDEDAGDGGGETSGARGDTVSPLDGEKGVTPTSPLGPKGVTPATARGDTGVTQSLKRTLKAEREGAGERGGAVPEAAPGPQEEGSARQDAVPTLEDFKRRWPTKTDDPDKVGAAFREMTATERREAWDGIDPFLEQRRLDKRTTVPSLDSFFRKRWWRDAVKAAAPKAGTAALAAGQFGRADAFSRVWWGAALVAADAVTPEMARDHPARFRLSKMARTAISFRNSFRAASAEAFAAATARAETLTHAMSNDPRAIAWDDWLKARGFDVNLAFAAPPFAVWLPAHDPPEAAAEERRDDWADRL